VKALRDAGAFDSLPCRVGSTSGGAGVSGGLMFAPPAVVLRQSVCPLLLLQEQKPDERPELRLP